MTPAPTDPDEDMRLAALARFRILDSVSEPEFDMLSRLIATICETPISLISLVDADRQWCKSTHGVEDCGTSREFSFCARAIENPTQLLVITDTHDEPSLVENPLVTGEPYIRFYAGVPLVTREGFALGTLCVIDRIPRKLSSAQFAALDSAARVVTTLIEQRVAIGLHDLELKRASLLRRVADNAIDAIVILEKRADDSIRVAYANPAHAKLTGVAPESFVGSDIDELPPFAGPTVAARWCRASIREGVPTTNEIPLTRADGTTILTEMCIGPGEAADAAGNQHWMLVIRDASALHRRDEARYASSHDRETGLMNEARLLAEIDASPPGDGFVALACIEIERLDDPLFGENSRDREPSASLAIAIARRLQAIADVRHRLARTGPTEFALAISGENPIEIDRIFATYARELAEPYRLGSLDAIVNASIGTASEPSRSEMRAGDLLALARGRLAEARTERRSRARVAAAIARDVETIDIRTLRAALRDDAFELHYQPIVELGPIADRIIGFEALLRWPQGAAKGWSTLEAILAAERTGFIEPLGSWIVDRACAQLAAWQNSNDWRSGANRLSVNISPGQLQSFGFEHDVRSTLARHGCDPYGLTLELTETASMRDPEAVRDVLVALRASGITIDLDDFGTGYSSLSRLHTFAIDRLKIDREFVSGAGEGIANERIVETILALADRMTMGIVAEGVETRIQRDELYRLGCRFAQGFLFGRAVDAASATKLLRANA